MSFFKLRFPVSLGYRHDFSRCIRSYITGRSSGRDYWIRRFRKDEERYDTGTAKPNEERRQFREAQAQLMSKKVKKQTKPLNERTSLRARHYGQAFGRESKAFGRES